MSNEPKVHGGATVVEEQDATWPQSSSSPRAQMRVTGAPKSLGMAEAHLTAMVSGGGATVKSVDRECGGCTLCCTLLPVLQLSKRANVDCVHQTASGCSVFGQPERPRPCRMWKCRWLRGDSVGRRPDRVGYVVDDLPVAPLIQVWVDPRRPQSWINSDLLRYIHGKMATHAVVIRYDAPGGERQIQNTEVIHWLMKMGEIDDESWPELRNKDG
jgi:hypothetical protein